MANQSSRAQELASEAAIYLKDRVDILIEGSLRDRIMAGSGAPDLECEVLSPGEDETDMLLVFGGDGTILRAARSIHPSESPICGVNLGRLGFLSQIEPKDLEPTLDRLISGDFDVSSRMKIDAYLEGELLGSALNELLVIGARIGKIFRCDLSLGFSGELLLEGDGVVVSTPTGSTGHSLSAGGCVVDPESNAIVVAPLGAMEPSRGFVLPAEREVVISPRDECSLALDGVVRAEAGEGSEIIVRRSESRTLFATFGSDRFWRKLRERIGG